MFSAQDIAASLGSIVPSWAVIPLAIVIGIVVLIIMAKIPKPSSDRQEPESTLGIITLPDGMSGVIDMQTNELLLDNATRDEAIAFKTRKDAGLI